MTQALELRALRFDEARTTRESKVQEVSSGVEWIDIRTGSPLRSEGSLAAPRRFPRSLSIAPQAVVEKSSAPGSVHIPSNNVRAGLIGVARIHLVLPPGRSLVERPLVEMGASTTTRNTFRLSFAELSSRRPGPSRAEGWNLGNERGIVVRPTTPRYKADADEWVL